MSNTDIDPTNQDSCVSFIQLILYYYIVNLSQNKGFLHWQTYCKQNQDIYETDSDMILNVLLFFQIKPIALILFPRTVNLPRPCQKY